MSVLVQNATTYHDADTYNVINTLASRNIVAMRDDSNVGQNLFLGASKDVSLYATEGMTFQLGSSNSLVITDSNAVTSLAIATDATSTSITAAAKDLILGTTDNSNYSIYVGATEISQSNNFQAFTTQASSGFLLNNPLKIAGYGIIDESLSVGGNVVCSSNIFTQNYNLFRHAATSNMVGYAFTINSNDQLELLKYTSFSNNQKVSKRVGIFGTKRLDANDNTDTSYAEFDTIGPLAVGGNAINFSSTGGGGGGTGEVLDGSITSAKLADSNITLSKIDQTTVGIFDVMSSSNLYYTTDNTMASGAVAIGMSNPQYKLDVNGDIHATGDIVGLSDRRFKTSFETIDNALEKIMTVRGYTFEKIGAPGKRYAGVIAQEMQQILPEVINVDDNGILSVAYGNIVSLLIEGIRELNVKVDALTK